MALLRRAQGSGTSDSGALSAEVSATVSATLTTAPTAPVSFSSPQPGATVGTQDVCKPIPIDLGTTADQAVVILYGTGIVSNYPNLAVSMVSSDARLSYASTVAYAGRAGTWMCGPNNNYVCLFPGLDQINVYIPHDLAGVGLLNVTVTQGYLPGTEPDRVSSTVSRSNTATIYVQ